MLSKHQIKLIKSLNQKKYRQQLSLFIVEGVKGINEFLNSDFKLHNLYTTKSIFDAPKNLTIEISETELKKISSLKSPNTALAVFKIPDALEINKEALIIALDDVRDPGNLGTIIRLCDWYGVKDLVCSFNTVDCYNPKVVQATMGSLTRINVNYLNLPDFISSTKETVFGTFMNGENIYNTDLPKNGIIVMGNEANGISEAVQNKITRRITIPQFGEIKETESLNVANATAIVLSEFKRRTIEK
ncbi:RNA methyltransferase [Winogradskyella sp.]|jgi:TrmH family RNA methyltransferase|uniref:TrmH family RNA methyltransferase n=1 Tax=Winogradskyella sp. TaxID=1883156 RepID=UPI0025E18247|nr:RNA methyltransferase [Winogradskyella sp.]MCT4630693.1 RNA methyltransferase [Winogradskyella sp.]